MFNLIMYVKINHSYNNCNKHSFKYEYYFLSILLKTNYLEIVVILNVYIFLNRYILFADFMYNIFLL